MFDRATKCQGLTAGNACDAIGTGSSAVGVASDATAKAADTGAVAVIALLRHLARLLVANDIVAQSVHRGHLLTAGAASCK